MRGKDITPGCELMQDGGRVVYTVEAVERKRIAGAQVVVCTVRYTDGGDGQRVFDPEAESGLVKPKGQEKSE